MINPFENIVPALFLCTVTLVSAVADVRTHKIPNVITFPAILMAISYYSACRGWDGFVFSTGGMCVGVALLLLPYLMGGMGAGDTKLMGAVGAVLGIERTVTAFLFISAMGCVYALLIIVFQRRRMKGYFKQMWLTAQGIILTRKYMPVQAAEEKRPKVYYGVAIAVGVLLHQVLEITGATPAI
jgi:prepilin peptidase CpaA